MGTSIIIFCADMNVSLILAVHKLEILHILLLGQQSNLIRVHLINSPIFGIADISKQHILSDFQKNTKRTPGTLS